MMAEAKTIDNLGPDASNRWARDQQHLDPSLIKEAPFVSKQSTTDITSPCLHSQCNVLLQSNQQSTPWASLRPPSGYHLQNKRLFTHQSIPSLGSDEFLGTQIQKIKDKTETDQESRKKRRKVKGQERYRWEEEREEKEELLEAKTLISFLERIQLLDSLITEINARRNQYQKG